MHPKVSVVVAVYNPGENIEPLITSLEAQSLAADELEVIFVDDGSTDGTGERLRGLVATHPTWTVKTIPNSGWPGRPRNLGMDLASGEYVFFADHDDEFLPEALGRMYAMGRENGSDIIYPKLVRMGRPTPYWSLARGSVAVADSLGDVLTSRTVHKLYRRQFLTQCGARFPEGRVRLEDHNFTSQVLPHAQVISVLADYPCYRWVHRSDGSNSSEAPLDVRAYWGYYTEVLRVAEREAGPGPLLDGLRVVAMLQAFSRVAPSKYLALSEEDRQQLFDALHAYVVEQFPAALDSELPVLKRLRVQALRAGDRGQFEAVQGQRAAIAFTPRLVEARWDQGRLQLALEVTLEDEAGDPYELGCSEGQLVLPVVPGCTDRAPEASRVLLPEDRGTVEVTVRHQRSGVEWPVATSQRLETLTVGGGVGLRVHADASVDLDHGVFGRPLEDGIWSLIVRAQFLGEAIIQALPAPDGVSIPTGPHAAAGRDAAVRRTANGRLVVRVPDNDGAGTLEPARPSVRRAGWADEELTLDLTAPEGDVGPWLAVRTRGQEEGRSVPIHDGTATVSLGGTAPGDIIDFYVHDGTPEDPIREGRLRFGEAQANTHWPYRIYETNKGSFSVKHVTTPRPAPKQPEPLLRRSLSRLRVARRSVADRARPR